MNNAEDIEIDANNNDASDDNEDSENPCLYSFNLSFTFYCCFCLTLYIPSWSFDTTISLL